MSDFADVAKSLLHAIKFEQCATLIPLLSNQLSQIEVPADIASLEGAIWVPVPYHKQKLKQRGFDLVQRLFDPFFAKLGYPKAAVLSRRQNSAPLYTLSVDERKEKLSGLFELDEKALASVKPKHIVLVDDIVTSGATMTELTTLIQEKCPQISLYYLSVCYTPYHD